MFSDYLNTITQNKILLSGLVGLLTIIIYYIDNRKKKNEVEFMQYIKLFIIVTILNYVSFHLINSKEIQKEANYSSINIGEPDF